MICRRVHTMVWLLSVCICWLLPLMAARRDMLKLVPLSGWIKQQADCAALFARREVNWNQPSYRVKWLGGADWNEVPRERLSPMPVSGHRQRLDRLVTLVQANRGVRNEAWPRLAAHLARQLEQERGDGAQVAQVEISRTDWPSAIPAMTNPTGRWQVPPLAILPAGVKLFTPATCQITDSGAVLINPPKPTERQPALPVAGRRESLPSPTAAPAAMPPAAKKPELQKPSTETGGRSADPRSTPVESLADSTTFHAIGPALHRR